MEKINKDIQKTNLTKLRLNFSRCAHRDIAPLRLNLAIYLELGYIEFPAISDSNQFSTDSLSQSFTIGYLSRSSIISNCFSFSPSSSRDFERAFVSFFYARLKITQLATVMAVDSLMFTYCIVTAPAY